jgi:hypothetical protein
LFQNQARIFFQTFTLCENSPGHFVVISDSIRFFAVSPDKIQNSEDAVFVPAQSFASEQLPNQEFDITKPDEDLRKPKTPSPSGRQG